MKDTNNCRDTSIAVIEYSGDGPVITISQDTSIIPGASAILSVTGGVSYAWEPSTGLSCTTCASPISTPENSANYCVTVTGSNGCATVACVSVTVAEIPCGALFIPNAFSPNADGNNDALHVRGLCFSDYNFTVYNRAGMVVFTSTDRTIGWDGLVEGTEVESSVFVWVLKGTTLTGEVIEESGNVSLVR